MEIGIDTSRKVPNPIQSNWNTISQTNLEHGLGIAMELAKFRVKTGSPWPMRCSFRGDPQARPAVIARTRRHTRCNRTVRWYFLALAEMIPIRWTPTLKVIRCWLDFGRGRPAHCDS